MESILLLFKLKDSLLEKREEIIRLLSWIGNSIDTSDAKELEDSLYRLESKKSQYQKLLSDLENFGKDEN